VFEGKAPRSEPAVWGPAMLVALVDLALAFLCYELFSPHGAGKASCSRLSPTQLFASIILLAGGKERWGRALLLGFLIFFAAGALIGFGFFVRWLAKVTGLEGEPIGSSNARGQQAGEMAGVDVAAGDDQYGRTAVAGEQAAAQR